MKKKYIYVRQSQQTLHINYDMNIYTQTNSTHIHIFKINPLKVQSNQDLCGR